MGRKTLSLKLSILAESVAISLAALPLKIGFLLYAASNPFVWGLFNDEAYHLQTAEEILRNGLIAADAFYFAPLYPYFVAATLPIPGYEWQYMLVVQAVIGAFHIGLVYLIAYRLFALRSIARIAAVMVFAYGRFWMYETLLLKTTLAAAVFAASVLAVLVARRKDTSRWWLAAGALFGIGSLLRGNTIIAAIAVVAYLAVVDAHRRRSIRPAILFSAAFLAALLPATIHNLIAGSDLVLTSAQGGVQLFIGNNPGADGGYVPLRPHRGLPGQERFDAFLIAEAAEGKALYPSEVSGWFLRQSVHWIVEHPMDWIEVTVTKLRLLHSWIDAVDTVDFVVYRQFSPLLWCFPLGFGPIFMFAAVGLLLAARELWRNRLFLVCLFASIASVALFFVLSRYRVPFVSLYIVLAAAGVYKLGALLRSSPRPAELAKLAGVGLAALVITFWPPAMVRGDHSFVAFNTLGNLYRDAGKYEQARACFKRVVEARPADFRLRSNLANVLRAMGQPCAARQQLMIAFPGYEMAARSGDMVAETELLRAANSVLEVSGSCGNTSSEDRYRRIALDSAHVLARAILARKLYPSAGVIHELETALGYVRDGQAPREVVLDIEQALASCR